MRCSTAEVGQQFFLTLGPGDTLPSVVNDFCIEKNISVALVEGSGKARAISLIGGWSSKDIVEIAHMRGTVAREGIGAKMDAHVVVVARDGALHGGVLRAATAQKWLISVTELRGDSEMLREPTEQAPPSSSTPQKASWASVAAASEAMGVPDADDQPPKAGDFVNHPTFGRCKVVRMSDEHLKIRREGGRTISLGLSRINLVLTGQTSDGKRTFAVEIRKPD